MSNPNLRPCDYEFIDIVFDGPASNESGRFVEVESPSGESIRVGEWIDRGDGFWALRIFMARSETALPSASDLADNAVRSMLETIAALKKVASAAATLADEISADNRTDEEQEALVRAVAEWRRWSGESPRKYAGPACFACGSDAPLLPGVKPR